MASSLDHKFLNSCRLTIVTHLEHLKLFPGPLDLLDESLTSQGQAGDLANCQQRQEQVSKDKGQNCNLETRTWPTVEKLLLK